MIKKTTNFRSNIASRSSDGSISFSNGDRIEQNGSSNTIIVAKGNKSLKSKLEAKSEISEGRVVLTLPIRTVSEANCFEHWTKKHKRHSTQRNSISLMLNPQKHKIKLPCKIHLTRLASRKLDAHDNLPMSFKYIVDAICAILTGNYKAGQADSDERISITYDQLISKDFGIIVELSF